MKIEKNYQSFNIFNKLTEEKKKDLTIFNDYLKYLINQRLKNAFFKILSVEPKKKHKVIHAKVDLLKRPIIIEEFSDNYQQFLSKGGQIP